MLSGLGAVWQSFLGFAVYDVLGKIRIPCLALTSFRPNGARPWGSADGETRSKAWRDACARMARRLCKSHLHVTASKIAFNLIKNRVIIQAPPQPVLLLAGFEDPPGEFQAFGFDPIALFSGTLLELRVVEPA